MPIRKDETMHICINDEVQVCVVIYINYYLNEEITLGDINTRVISIAKTLSNIGISIDVNDCALILPGNLEEDDLELRSPVVDSNMSRHELEKILTNLGYESRDKNGRLGFMIVKAALF